MDLLYHLIAMACIGCCCWWFGKRATLYLIAAIRKRSNAIDDEEPDILLTHEADEYAALLDEEHVEDWRAWTDELDAKARKLAEKLDGAR